MDIITVATGAVTLLAPYLVKVGEKAAEKVGEKLPEAAAKVWNAIMARFTGKLAAEEAIKDFVAMPDDEDNRAAFRKELRKVLEAEPTFVDELARLLDDARRQSGDTIINTGSGAVATGGSVAAGAGGVAVGGNVRGNIGIGGSEKKG